jgi:hypothetical protein
VEEMVWKIPEDEKELVPLAHTVCTWNSYHVEAVRPVTFTEVVVELTVVQFPEYRMAYLTL